MVYTCWNIFGQAKNVPSPTRIFTSTILRLCLIFGNPILGWPRTGARMNLHRAFGHEGYRQEAEVLSKHLVVWLPLCGYLIQPQEIFPNLQIFCDVTNTYRLLLNTLDILRSTHNESKLSGVKIEVLAHI